jgi:hypothetical protein
LLADYEEGTWTPTTSSITVNSGSFTSEGTYTKIGRQVTVVWRQTGGNITTVGGTSYITGLPFASGSSGQVLSAGAVSDTAVTGVCAFYNASGEMRIYIATTIAGTTGIALSLTYFV